MTFTYDGQRPKIFRAQVNGEEGYALLLDQDDPDAVLYFSSWQGGLTRWLSELNLLIDRLSPEDVPTIEIASEHP
ncbi:hypothetical protein [Spongiactinospora sp. TRM90649]|uniref:hypothetical protein n=1 Tax=Spongiactinospora sp. TRM90649 TaxID=3031114 RepID=UPI0023F89EE5|nr:hypothetical protein [Spongiactinospora sp. TRM90649]MDF5757321.1 hypothetical protein [Spongiactinospora sp. TRM90649]